MGKKKQTAEHQFFQQQADGTAKRIWPHGRIAADDDGELAVMIAADKKRGVIHVRFPKPIEWIGLDVPSAEALVANLQAKLAELKK